MTLNFTLAYGDGTNDVDDAVGDVARVGTWGPMHFEPVIDSGARLVSTDGGTIPRMFFAYLDNGVLKNRQGGTPNIRLWANDPAWNIGRFQYRVRAELTDSLGRPVPWRPFCFDAPSADVTRNLKDYIPVPGQSFGRGPDGWPVDSVEEAAENVWEFFVRGDSIGTVEVSEDLSPVDGGSPTDVGNGVMDGGSP